MPSQNELRTEITARIVEALSTGNLPPWRPTWRADHNCGSPANVKSRRNYSGVNPYLLGIAARRHGFQSRWWGTFNQWTEMGGRVKARPADVSPGRWGTQIVFCRPYSKITTTATGEQEDTFFLLKTFTVFCVDQVDGPFDHLRAGNAPLNADDIHARHEEAERVIAATGADIRHGGDRAFYRPSEDYIQLPHRGRFESAEAYYETAFHEAIHWTEHPTRLNWNRAEKENTYGVGELVAELGACYLMGEVGLPTADTWQNSASYLNHWLKAMHADPRFIFRVTAQANRATTHILSYSRQEAPEEATA